MSRVIVKKEHLSTNAIDRFYGDSFGDMPNGSIYHDPLGARTGQKGFSLKPEWYKKDKPWFDTFNEVQRNGAPNLREAIRMTNDQVTMKVASSFDTSHWNIPAFYTPRAYVADPERTPLADLVSRQTVDSDVVKVTTQSGTPSGTQIATPLENNSYSAVDYSNSYFKTSSFDVQGYGIQSEIEDLMILANRTFLSVEQEAERLHTKTIREYEEAQMIYGATSAFGASGHAKMHTSGMSGLNDFGSSGVAQTTLANLNPKEDVRELIDTTEYAGANRSDLAVITNFQVHRKLRNTLDDYVRYEVPSGELGFGMETLKFDGVPIFKSHGVAKDSDLNGGNDQGYVFCVDMSSTFMAMLQDITMKPLAKVDPYEQMAVDAYGVLCTEAPSHIKYISEP